MGAGDCGKIPGPADSRGAEWQAIPLGPSFIAPASPLLRPSGVSARRRRPPGPAAARPRPAGGPVRGGAGPSQGPGPQPVFAGACPEDQDQENGTRATIKNPLRVAHLWEPGLRNREGLLCGRAEGPLRTGTAAPPPRIPRPAARSCFQAARRPRPRLWTVGLNRPYSHPPISTRFQVPVASFRGLNRAFIHLIGSQSAPCRNFTAATNWLRNWPRRAPPSLSWTKDTSVRPGIRRSCPQNFGGGRIRTSASRLRRPAGGGNPLPMSAPAP